MKIVPIAHGLDDYLLAPSVGRTRDVLHVSDIYNSLYQKLEPKKYDPSSPPNTLKMAMGSAWENYQEDVLKRAGVEAYRPSEQTTVEGIKFSPDHLLSNTYLNRPAGAEFKLTWMSESDDLTQPKFQKYLTQAMTYGHHLEMPDWIFFVNYVNGGMKGRRQPGPQNPSLRAYHAQFTAREMREEWQMLLNHARDERML